MKRALLLGCCAFFFGSIAWMLLNARWESAYVVQEESGTHSYLMDLDTSPLWAQPDQPTFSDFSHHFSSATQQLPEDGSITVYHQWKEWIVELIMIWLIGFVVITPVSLSYFRKDRQIGAIGRVGAGLIGAALVCFVLWLALGGWGPPSPLLFGIIGLVAGGAWAACHAANHSAANKAVAPTPDPPAS